MSATKPIKDLTALENFKNFYLSNGDYRNNALVILGLNTALRISDVLNLTWNDVYNHQTKHFRGHIDVIEMKTGKKSIIALNPSAIEALELYLNTLNDNNMTPKANDYIFAGRNHTGKPISRFQAFRVIKDAAISVGLDENISCHSLRKTFGYCAWKQGVSPVMLMNIYNHSSFQITKRYLCIEQEERDDIFMNIKI